MYNTLWLMDLDAHRIRQENLKNFNADPTLLSESSRYRAADPPPYLVKDRVAVIDFNGPITNRGSFFSFMFGEAVLPDIEHQIEAADADADVDGIVLCIDSPGGPPAGLTEFTETARRCSKQIVGFCDGMAASGGYWAASSLNSLVISKTASVGSIGVIAILTEVTKAAEKEGYTLNVLRAGKYKAMGNRYEPLTAAGRAEVQGELDSLYSVFIDAVAENRGITTQQVLPMADGKVFIGQEAVDVGLADKIGSLEDAINLAANNNNDNREEEMEIKTVSAMQEAFPELCATLQAEAVAGVEIPDVAVESVRVLALAGAVFGEESGKKLAGIVNAGVTLEQYQSIAGAAPVVPVVPATDPTEQAKILAALQTGDDKIPALDAQGDGAPVDFMGAWKQIKAAENCTTKTAMSMASRKYPALYAAHSGHTEGAK